MKLNNLNLFQIFKNLKLRTQLISILSLNTIIPILIVSFISYRYSENMFLMQTEKSLNDIAEREVVDIDGFFNKHKMIAKSLTDLAAQLFKEVYKDQNSSNTQKQIAEFRSFIDGLGFNNFYLFSDDKKLIYKTADNNNIDVDKEISFNNTENKSVVQIYFSNPIIENGLRIGSLVVDMKPQILKDWYSFINSYSILEKSGEIVFGVLQNDNILLVIPPRNGLDDSSSAALMEDAILGLTTSGLKTDKNGIQVLTATKKISNLDGGLVVKVDYSDIIVPLFLMKFMFLAASLATSGLIILIAPNIAAYILGPVKSLIKKTRQMASGDLAQRIEITSTNELGLLAISYNEMAEKIEQLVNHLDELVEQRTHELVKTINDLKVAQERLISQEKLASLGAITAGVAHEIKNPLNFVNNFSLLTIDLLPILEKYIERKDPNPSTEVLSEVDDTIKTMKENLKHINEQGRRADNIVRRMLAHSSSQRGNFERVDINLLLKEAVDLTFHTMRSLHPDISVKIDLDLDPNLGLQFVVGEDLTRVILNLLNNSIYSVMIKAKNNELFQPTITILSKKEVDVFVIKVIDNGLGIPEEKKINIFTPFYTTKPPGEGTGLGLSLSFNIITQEHEGRIEFMSLEGVSTEFIITLPIKDKVYAS